VGSNTNKKESLMHSNKEYEVKVKKLNKEIERLQKKVASNALSSKEKSEENKYLRRRLKALIISRDN